MKYINLIAVLTSVITLLYVVAKTSQGKTQKIGIVQMDKLVYEYNGMKDASIKYANKLEIWTRETDSIAKVLSNLYDLIKVDSMNHDNEKRIKHIAVFKATRLWYNDKLASTQEKAINQDKEMTGAVVGQLKSYIKKYADEKGYDLIICNTEQQNIGLASAETDLTLALLDYANTKYDGH